jgi:YHS domain-containing protein
MSYEGQAYFFCSEECRRTFAANPKAFVGNVADQDRGSETLPPVRD